MSVSELIEALADVTWRAIIIGVAASAGWALGSVWTGVAIGAFMALPKLRKAD